MRIEISGALATGKTTLAKRLEDRGYHLVFEDLSTNPYLDLRKEDPERYDLPCQRTFVSDKLSGISRAISAGHRNVICDFSLAAELAYVRHYLSARPEWVSDLEARVEEGYSRLGLPDAIIHLTIDPMRQLERIRSRGREFEQGHDVGFLSAIRRQIDDRVEELRRRGIRIIEIDAIALERDGDTFEGIVTEISGVFAAGASGVDVGGAMKVLA